MSDDRPSAGGSRPVEPYHAELARIALEVAEEAARLVMVGFRTSLVVRHKAEQQLVTEYDLKSEERIRVLLAQRTPTMPVVGEELGGQQPGDSEAGVLTWCVDPIDGTNNFISGHPVFAVSVGAMSGEHPVAGAVVAPALGLSWHGAAGGLAFRNGEPCRVSDTAELGDAVVTTGYPQSPPRQHLEAVAALASSTRDLRRCGSAAVELCWVADGTYDVYWMRRLSPWDTAAGAALVLGAGGSWRRVGQDDRFHDIASNGVLDAQIDGLLRGRL